MTLYAWWGYLVLAVLSLLALRCVVYDVLGEL